MTSPDKASKLERLLALTRGLGSAPDMEQFFQRLTVATTELTNSEAASILKFDETSNSLRFIAAPWFHQQSLKDVIVPLDESMAGWAFGNNKPLVIQDVAKDSRHFEAVDQAANFTTTSLLAVPMAYQGNTIGVLEAVNKLGNAHYTEDDVTILEMLAIYAAMALSNFNLETRVQNTDDEIAKLDRLKSKFIAITSHELRTPLGLILGHATFLKEMIAEEHHEPVETIIRNATRLKEIIENLTDVDNYETGKASIRQGAISIPRLLEEVASSFQDMAASKNITLQADIPEEGLQVEADTSKITVAISNLVRNAIAFSNEGGKVLIKAGALAGHVQVSVKDNGIGIPARDLSHVFERFFQVESHLTRRHDGMGLGLSVAKTMVELHGGRIWVESVEGQGSTFTFLLPLKPVQNKSVEQASIS